MGYKSAVEISESELTIEQKLEWHLRGNHYPPVPSSMVKPCIEAIDLANQGYWSAEVQMPEGVSYRGSSTAPASAIVEQHHLYAFMDTDGEDY